MGRPPGARNKPKDTAMPAATKTADRTADVAETATSKGEVAIFSPPRLPYHPAVEERFGIDKGTWKVLVEAIFPAAKTVDAIAMALSYCKSRGLDVMKRPVHIVPMWDSARGAMVETVWPGISELRTTASRTAGYAGCDVAEFGEPITMDFSGRVRRGGGWEDIEVKGLEFPEWCRITVYRIVAGQRCKFVGPKVSWLETYATQGQSELPNKMWQERPEGQLEKCAEAAALRRAFPEELGSELTAEEMVGKTVQHDIEIGHAEPVAADAGSRDIAPPRSAPTAAPAEPTHDPEEARDGTPPRRPAKAAEPKPEPKSDPISSGPQRQPESSPSDPGPKPHRIPGEGHTFETWADKFCDFIKTSPDIATVYGWIDSNSKEFQIDSGPKQAGPLTRLQKGKPSVAAMVKKTTEQVMEKLRDAQKKAEDKAAKKAAPKEPPSDMADQPGEMDDNAEPGANEFGEPADDNPETILRWIEDVLRQVEAPEDLENIWTSECLPRIADLMPPDKDEAQGILRKHEKRLEP